MNPYQPPGPPPGYARARPVSRTPFVLAGVGAFLASAYWALLTLLIGLASATGSASSMNLILPIVLIALYAWRGINVIKGDPASARSLLWLHGIGGFFAMTQLTHGGGIFVVLQGLKVLIHVFGGITAFLAHRQATQMPPMI